MRKKLVTLVPDLAGYTSTTNGERPTSCINTADVWASLAAIYWGNSKAEAIKNAWVEFENSYVNYPLNIMCDHWGKGIDILSGVEVGLFRKKVKKKELDRGVSLKQKLHLCFFVQSA